MELVIQKAVELGAYEIIPVSMKRCVAKIEDGKRKRKNWSVGNPYPHLPQSNRDVA